MRQIAFNVGDLRIHDVAVDVLLGSGTKEVELRQGDFAYCVKGGDAGHLQYRKKGIRDWVLVANWCFYGAYVVVRYRKVVWLRPMYEHLFSAMNYTILAFGLHSIELLANDGSILTCRQRSFSPPGALRAVLEKKLGFDELFIGRLAGRIVK